MQLNKRFYEANTLNGYTLVNEVVYPHCPTGYEPGEVFLVYAENEQYAFDLAMEHLYDNRKENLWSGIYNGEKYEDVRCIS